jgi:predicted phosphoribosyltransferase
MISTLTNLSFSQIQHAMRFKNREEAAILLAAKLKKYQHEHCVVLALPRGGVPMAQIVAKELKAPMDLILVKKIGHPLNKEYAIGAASFYDSIIEPHENVSDAYIMKEVETIRARLKEMHEKFIGHQKTISIEGKVAIIVDDGVATGHTIVAAIKIIRKKNPSKIVLAVPVSSKDALEKIKQLADETICLLQPTDFSGIAAFYEDFNQVSDEEVIAFMKELH